MWNHGGEVRNHSPPKIDDVGGEEKIISQACECVNKWRELQQME